MIGLSGELPQPQLRDLPLLNAGAELEAALGCETLARPLGTGT
jgi:hypothetical protein